MNAKQTNGDKIYVYSSFKQFCSPVLVFLGPELCTALNWDSNFVYKCLIQKLLRSGNQAGRWKLIITYISI